jgi:hypothetical protein
MMMTNTDTDQIRGTATIYAAWEAGEISPTEALRLLGDELDAMKAEFAPALKMYEGWSYAPATRGLKEDLRQVRLQRLRVGAMPRRRGD